MRKLFLLLLCLFTHFAVTAQEDSLLQRIVLLQDSLTESRNTSMVYLHVDKTSYHKGENIWFTAYLLKQTAPDTLYHTLFAALVRAKDKKPVLHQRFVLQDRFAHGYLYLPDSLAYDDYYLMAFTNAVEWDATILPFQQAIQLVSLEKPMFRVYETAIKEYADTAYYTYRVVRGDERLFVHEKLTYSIQQSGKLVQQGIVQTDISGNCTVAVPKRLFQSPLQLHVQIKEKREAYNFDFALKPPSKRLLLKWYPESGRLVADVPVKMGIEASYEDGSKCTQPIKLSLCNDADTLTTLQLINGQGVLNILPSLTTKYRWVTSDTTVLIKEASSWEIAPYGYVLQVANAMPDSLLQVNIHSKESGVHYLVLKKQQNLLYNAKIVLRQTKARMQIPIAQFARGLATLILYDNAGTAVAERAVYLRGRKQVNAVISMDSTAYRKRSLAQATVLVTDDAGKPVHGIFSMGVVLKSRYDSNNVVGIQEYLDSESFAIKDFTHMENVSALDAYLLIQCWTAYRWPALVNKRFGTNLFFTGRLISATKEKRTAFGVSLINKSESAFLQLIVADSSGYFRIPARYLYAKPDQRFWIIPSPRGKEPDLITMLHKQDSVVHEIGAGLTQTIIPKTVQLPKADVMITSMSTLPAVVVKASNSSVNERRPFHSKNCDDYICMYNILNCLNHPYGTKPMNGQVYTYRGAMVVYFGCNGDDAMSFLEFPGTNYTKEFYQADYTKFNPTEPELFSTVYWNHGVSTNANGEAKIAFYTNDLYGQLQIHIQGVSSAGVFSSAKVISVKSGFPFEK